MNLIWRVMMCGRCWGTGKDALGRNCQWCGGSGEVGPT